MSRWKLHTPEGVQDILQEECMVKREIEERIAAMQTLYTTDNIETVRGIIDEYDVDYITVGLLERVNASSIALEHFATLAETGELEIAFESGDARVYRVP